MARRVRRFAFGLLTLSGLAPRGWFIPVRHARPERRPAYPALEPLFAAAQPAMRAVLDEIGHLAADLDRIPAEGPHLRWRQSWFPRLDAAAAYAITRREKPARIVEIGSGHSTRFLARAVADGGLATTIIAIDPEPRAAIAGLPVTHVASMVEDADPAVFAALGAGDVLFIDSSHVAMPGSDVDRLVLDILPRLPVGVLIHVHDVFLPDAYPADWTWRGYNEQLLVGALLQGQGFDIVFASRYAATRLAGEVAATVGRLPLAEGANETSVWLRKR